MKSPLKTLIFLLLFFVIFSKLSFKESFRQLQEEGEEEEEEYYEDEVVPIETYQRRSVRIGTQRSSISKVFHYHIYPINSPKEESVLIIDLYTRIFSDVQMYIYTDLEDIYYDPRTKTYKDAIYETELYNLDQVIITEGDFLNEESDIYIVFCAPEVENFRTYITINFNNELYEVYNIFRYTYYNEEPKVYYFHLVAYEETRYMYLQFQSLTNDPNCTIQIYQDPDFEDLKKEYNMKENQFSDSIQLQRNKDYYVILTLDRVRTSSHGYYFDVAFSFSQYDTPIVIDFEEGFSQEFPVLVNQTLYYFVDVSDHQGENIIIRGNSVGDKIKKYSYAFYNKNSPSSVAEDFSKSDFSKLKENYYTFVGGDVYIKVPRNDKSKKIMGFAIEFGNYPLNAWDTIEIFYMLKILKDAVSYGEYQLEGETLLFVSPSNFEDNNDILIISTSSLNAISFVDFEKEETDESILEYLTIYKTQFYIFDKNTLPNEILLVINEEESYCEFKYKFLNDVVLFSNKFDSYGRLFSLDDCSKTYLMISEENPYRSEEDKTYLFFRKVYGDSQIFFGNVYEYNNEIDALFLNKYVYDDLIIYDANEEFFVKMTCNTPSNVHLIYFDSTDTFTADTGNFYPVYLDSKKKPYDERALEMVARKFDFELELLRDHSQYVQSFTFTFQEREFYIDLKNPKTFLGATLTEQESLEFSDIKGKNLVFFKMDLEEDEYDRYEEAVTLNQIPENKVLVFPFTNRLMVQTFTLNNKSDRSALVCIYNDYSSVYIHPRGGSCFYLHEDEKRVLTFQFGNLFRVWSMVADEEFYTVISVDENIILDYKIEEGEDPGYDDSDEFDEEEEGDPEEYADESAISASVMNTLILLFLIVLCSGILVVLRINKYNDPASDMAKYSLDGGIN